MNQKMIEYKKANQTHLAQITLLLERKDLPASDCLPHLENFVVALDGAKVVGVGGFESCENLGLLRSFAVLPENRGLGIAEAIFKILCSEALEQGKSTLYLLTTTAANYFEKLGFEACERTDCPAEIKRTKQFAELCPDSATTMVRSIRPE